MRTLGSCRAFLRWSGLLRGGLLVACFVGAGWAGLVAAGTGSDSTGRAGTENPLRASLPSGFLGRAAEVRLEGGGEGVEIRFTLDGGVPTRGSTRYAGPILLTNTAVIRARAFGPGDRAGAVLTRTYLFPGSVLSQTGAGFPAYWGFTNGQPVKADYAMDPELQAGASAKEGILRGLRSLPTLSLVTTVSNLFDPKHGIYANPMETGVEWEREAAVEWIFPDGRPPISAACGVRIQGGWNRRPEECPKHSLRLLFKSDYGTGKLRGSPFRAAGPTEFDTLILRGGCNNTWLHWSGEERRRGDYVRDQWARDTAAAMGRAAARGDYVHLYLNGLYWGLYNMAERPDGRFAAQRFGGKEKDYDARNSDKVLSGSDAAWKELFRWVNAPGPLDFRRVEGLIDIDAFADYMLINLYGANGDWDRASNWYAARRNSPSGRYLFFIWDAERTLEQPADSNRDVDDDLSPTRLFQRLSSHPAFQERFAARVKAHCNGDGVLTPGSAAARYQKRADEIREAMLAEAARWGDYRKDEHPYKTGPFELYTRDSHWTPEVNRLLTVYFPKRTGILLEQLRGRGLYRSDGGKP